TVSLPIGMSQSMPRRLFCRTPRSLIAACAEAPFELVLVFDGDFVLGVELTLGLARRRTMRRIYCARASRSTASAADWRDRVEPILDGERKHWKGSTDSARMRRMEGSRQLSSRALLRVGFVFEASLVGVAVVLARIHTGEWFPFRLEMDLEAVAWTAGATVPLILFAIFFSTDAALRFRPFRRMYRVLGSLMGKALVGLSPLQLAVLALSAGVGEEFLFRGVIQNEWGGIGTASLIFALLHAVTPAYFVFAFAISVYFGWIY